MNGTHNVIIKNNAILKENTLLEEQSSRAMVEVKFCVESRVWQQYSKVVPPQGAHYGEHVYWSMKFFLYVNVVSQGIGTILYTIGNESGRSGCQSLLSH